jgi:hypothetical protein
LTKLAHSPRIFLKGKDPDSKHLFFHPFIPKLPGLFRETVVGDPAIAFGLGMLSFLVGRSISLDISLPYPKLHLIQDFQPQPYRQASGAGKLFLVARTQGCLADTCDIYPPYASGDVPSRSNNLK